MGNFSRNTFDPDKNYVGVRLQQGVPLVDADWNELNDVIRNEIYRGLGQAFPDGVLPGSIDLQIIPTDDEIPTNDLKMEGGSVLVGGRPLRVPTTVLYSAQPWFSNPTRADQDGVTVIPPLTPPGANRTDIVYLDVWEREVRSTEDTNLIHSAIGVETCVRLKREFAFRVAEGTQTLPATPAGHSFVPLALLKRPAGQVSITLPLIADIRPKLFNTRGTRSIAFPPAFLPVNSDSGGSANALSPWLICTPTGGSSVKVYAMKPSGQSAFGVLPLILPDGARIRSLKVNIGTTTSVGIQMLRIKHPTGTGASFFDSMVDTIIQGGPGNTLMIYEPFEFGFSPIDPKMVVDNTQYYYVISVGAVIGIGGHVARIHGISVVYEY